MRRFPEEACLVGMTWRARESVPAARMAPHVKPLWWWRRRACHHTPESTHQPAEEDRSVPRKMLLYISCSSVCIYACVFTCFPSNQTRYGMVASRPRSRARFCTSVLLPVRGITESWSPLHLRGNKCYMLHQLYLSFMLHQSWEDPRKEKVQVQICIMV
jgi:hypothetical protein